MANIIHSFCWTMSTGSVHAVEKKQYLADVKILDGYLEKDCIKSIFSIISDAFAVKNGGSMPFDCNNFKKVFVLQEEITAGSMARWIADYIITRCVDNDSTIHIESVTVYCDDGNSQEYSPKGGFEYKSFKYASNVTTKPLQTGGGTLQRMQEDGERSDPKNIPAVPDSEKKESYRETIDIIQKNILSEYGGKVPISVNSVSINMAMLMNKVYTYIRLTKEGCIEKEKLMELECFLFHFGKIVGANEMYRYPEIIKEEQGSIDSGAIDDGSAKTK